MTTLLLIRHGIAEEWHPGQPDMERALTEEGWRRTRAAMKGLVALGLAPDRGISSPYRRAMETMACLKEASPILFPVGVWDGLTPESDPAAAEAWLRILLRGARDGERIAFTSHQPFLGELVHRLTGKDVEVKKASCTLVRWQDGAFRYSGHHGPKDLIAAAS